MKNPQRYRRLAELARGGGYLKVTEFGVQSWAKRGILPSARVDHTAFSVRTISESPDLAGHLSALCRYRYDLGIRDIALIGLLLWVDGYEVRIDAIRKGLYRVAHLPSRLINLVRGHGPDDPSPISRLDHAAFVAVYEKGFADRRGRPDLDKAVLASGIFDLVTYLHGSTGVPALDPEAMAEVGKLVGLDRAHRQGQLGKLTWSPEPPAEALVGVLPQLREATLIDQVWAATEDDLERARRDGRVIAAALKFASDNANLPGIRDSGLSELARDVPTHLVSALAVFAALSDERSQRFADELRSRAGLPDSHSE